MKRTCFAIIALFGFAAPASQAEGLTLNTGDTITISGSGSAGNIGATIYTPFCLAWE